MLWSARSGMPMWQSMAARTSSMAISDKTSRRPEAVVKGGLGLLINTATSLVVAEGWAGAAPSTRAGAGFGGLRSRLSTLRLGL